VIEMAGSRTIARTWRTPVDGVRLKGSPNKAGYASVRPALKRMVTLLGNNQTAEVLGVAKSQPSRWCHGESIGPESARRIAGVDYVLVRALQVFHPDEAARWLTYPQPFLNNSRPLDVLIARGAAPVIGALDQIEQGAMA